MTILITGPVDIRPTHLHRQTGRVLHELAEDRQERRITDAWGRCLGVLLHPSDPRLTP